MVRLVPNYQIMSSNFIKVYKLLVSNAIFLLIFCRKRFHMRGSPPIIIKNILPPRQFDYPEKNRLKKFSSSISLPPTTIFPLKDFNTSSNALKKIPAITDGVDSGSIETFNNNYNKNFYNNQNIDDYDDDIILSMNDEFYNFYDYTDNYTKDGAGGYYNIQYDESTGKILE